MKNIKLITVEHKEAVLTELNSTYYLFIFREIQWRPFIARFIIANIL